MVKGKQVYLIGQVFGKLTVISKANSIWSDKVKRYWGAWNCICECNNKIIVKTIDLTRGRVKSCGCAKYGRKYVPGQKINRLTTISFKNGKWICLCQCGNAIEVLTDALTSNNTKSCGCLKTDNLKARAFKLSDSVRRFTPLIASARRVWKNYCYRDTLCDITFEDFFKISQQNCYYCNGVPNTKYNYFSTISSRSSITAKNEGLFIYNGMDRLNNNLPHTLNNVVACCYTCNRAKNNRSIQDFLEWVNNLTIIDFQPIVINKVIFPKGSLATSIKCVFFNYKNDTDMTIEEYYSISQNNCYYCNSAPNNIFNKAKTDKKSSEKAKINGDYIYNGIDRIDRAIPHNKNNIVPCCKYCNFAKSKLTLIEFHNWIKNIQTFQKQKAQNNLGFLQSNHLG